MTGRQFILKILESKIDLDNEIAISVRQSDDTSMFDNYYGIESINNWTHPEDGEYARIILR